MSDIDDLFDAPPLGQTWFDSLSDDAQTWVRQVAERRKEKGKNPSPTLFLRTFAEKFPNDPVPKTNGTIRDNLERLCPTK